MSEEKKHNHSSAHDDSNDKLVELLKATLADQKTNSTSSSANVGLKLNKDSIIISVLVILIIISGVQTAKLSNLQSGGTNFTPTSASSSSNGGSSLDSSLNNLPSQVGGC